MNDDLAPLADHLNEPPPPPTLLPAVMARVERAAEARETTPAPARAPRVRDGALVAGFAAGLVTMAGATMWAWLGSGVPLDTWSPKVLEGQAGLIGVGDAAALPFVLGLALYLFVLFAPLRTRGRA